MLTFNVLESSINFCMKFPLARWLTFVWAITCANQNWISWSLKKVVGDSLNRCYGPRTWRFRFTIRSTYVLTESNLEIHLLSVCPSSSWQWQCNIVWTEMWHVTAISVCIQSEPVCQILNNIANQNVISNNHGPVHRQFLQEPHGTIHPHSSIFLSLRSSQRNMILKSGWGIFKSSIWRVRHRRQCRLKTRRICSSSSS